MGPFLSVEFWVVLEHGTVEAAEAVPQSSLWKQPQLLSPFFDATCRSVNFF